MLFYNINALRYMTNKPITPATPATNPTPTLPAPPVNVADGIAVTVPKVPVAAFVAVDVTKPVPTACVVTVPFSPAVALVTAVLVLVTLQALLASGPLHNPSTQVFVAHCASELQAALKLPQVLIVNPVFPKQSASNAH